MPETAETQGSDGLSTVTPLWKKSGRINELPYVNEVRERVSRGITLSEIATWIHEEKGDLKELTLQGVISALYDYRESLPLIEVASRALPSAVIEKAREVVERLDALREMEDLYKFQKTRVDIDHRHEVKLKKLLKTMPIEIDLARQMLRDILTAQQELGLNPKNLGKLEMDAQVQAKLNEASGIRPEFKAVLADPVKARKVAAVLERLVGLGQEKRDAILKSLSPAQKPPAEVYGPTPGAEFKPV